MNRLKNFSNDSFWWRWNHQMTCKCCGHVSHWRLPVTSSNHVKESRTGRKCILFLVHLLPVRIRFYWTAIFVITKVSFYYTSFGFHFDAFWHICVSILSSLIFKIEIFFMSCLELMDRPSRPVSPDPAFRGWIRV